MTRPINYQAWAIGEKRRNGFAIRRIVWGRTLARAERREGESIRRAFIELDAPDDGPTVREQLRALRLLP